MDTEQNALSDRSLYTSVSEEESQDKYKFATAVLVQSYVRRFLARSHFKILREEILQDLLPYFDPVESNETLDKEVPYG